MRLLVKGKFGFRPWPLQSCVTNTLLRLNNKDFNTRESRTGCLHAVMQYISSDKLKELYSFMPHTERARHRSLLTPLILTIREPVIAEPLNYSPGTNYGNCMWSVSNLELNLPVWFSLQDDLHG